jgi:hypothetical protein
MVPVALAEVSCHVPSLVLLPEEAAFIQSDGSVRDAKRVPESAVAQVAGCVPERISRIAVAPVTDSTESSHVLRRVVASIYSRDQASGRVGVGGCPQ